MSKQEKVNCAINVLSALEDAFTELVERSPDQPVIDRVGIAITMQQRMVKELS